MLILLATRDIRTPVRQESTSTYEIIPTQTNTGSYLLSTSTQQNTDSIYQILVGQTNDAPYTIWQTHEITVEGYYSILTEQTNISSYNIESFFYSHYNISIAQHQESQYSILVQKKADSTYSILLGQQNGSAFEILVGTQNESEYDALLSKQIEIGYSILVARENIGVYTIPLKVRHQSEYAIWQIFHPVQTNESSYRITNFTYVNQYNESTYEISLTGVIAVSERYFGLEDPYLLYTSERTTHLHLFNTYTTDRTSIFEVYTTNFNERTGLVVREIIGDERSSLFEVYTTNSDERTTYTSSIIVETSERSVVTSGYATTTSDRSTILSQIAHLSTARNAILSAIYNDYRWCYAKSWHVAERICILHAKEKDRIGDQRYCVAQTKETHAEVIRYCYFESCSLSFNLTINPQYELIPLTSVQTTFQPLFEDEKVTEFVNKFNQIPVEFTASGVDLILVNDDADFWVNLGDNAFVQLPLTQISTNTFMFKGYLIHRHKPLFTKLEVGFMNLDTFSNPDEYYDYLVRHGYLKMVIEREEMSDREVLVDCKKPMSPIPFEIYILDDLLSNVVLDFTWAYPYKKLVVHKSILTF